MQQTWQASVAFPHNSIENVIGKVSGKRLEHEHANEYEEPPVESISKSRFAHACAESVLQFASKTSVEVTM